MVNELEQKLKVGVVSQKEYDYLIQKLNSRFFSMYSF